MGKKKNGGKWRFIEGQDRRFSVLEAGASKHKPLIWPLLCRPTFLAPDGKRKCRAPFSGEDVVGDDDTNPKLKREFRLPSLALFDVALWGIPS